MYNQNFRNQAVKEVKNGSTVTSVSRKFGISPNTLNSWIGDYDKKIYEMTNKGDFKTALPTQGPAGGIEIQSVKILINGAVVTLKRNDVLNMLKLFNIFDGRIEEG